MGLGRYLEGIWKVFGLYFEGFLGVRGYRDWGGYDYWQVWSSPVWGFSLGSLKQIEILLNLKDLPSKAVFEPSNFENTAGFYDAI